MSPAKPQAPAGSPEHRVDSARFVFGATQLAQFPPPTLTEIAFAGRSNVGKSSLMNSLTGRNNLVRTSSTPGCTRQVSWFHVRVGDGAEFYLVDLPGYGYAKRSKGERGAWARLIESYLLDRPTLRGVVMLVDVRRGVEPDDLDLLRLLEEAPMRNRPALQVTLVATKLDKLSRAARKPAIAKIEKEAGRRVLGYSVPEARGRITLLTSVRAMTGLNLPETSTGRVEEASNGESV